LNEAHSVALVAPSLRCRPFSFFEAIPAPPRDQPDLPTTTDLP
jgi:hypothetical protein